MRDLEMSVVFMHERVKRLVVWVPFYDTLASRRGRGDGCSVFSRGGYSFARDKHLDLRMEIPHD